MQPEFCITRPNGVVSALIAVDELPPFVAIRGVPRCLGHIDDAHGMTNVGTVGSRGQFYTIDVAVEANTRPINVGLANGVPNGEIAIALQSAITIGGNGIFRQPGPVDAAIWSPNSEERTIMTWRNGVNDNAVTNTGQEVARLDDSPPQRRESTSQNENNPKTPPKKEYCSFWIRRGECDYAQQGCLFKHQMPRDPETLGRLGLRDIPRWYREKYKVKSIVGSDGMDTRANIDRGWRPMGPMSPMFPGSFPATKYGLPPPRFNVDLAEEEDGNGGPRYAPVVSTNFAPNGVQLAHDMRANMLPTSICSSLSEKYNMAVSMVDDKSVWKDFGHSAIHDPVGYCASTSAVSTGIPSMAFANVANAATNQHGIDRNCIVHSHSQTGTSRTNSIWAMTNRNNDEMSSTLLSPFQSMTMTEPQGPMTSEQRMNDKSKPHPFQPQTTHASSSNSPFPTDYAYRNSVTPATKSQVGLLSSFSSPIPSPTRTQSFRSSRSAWTGPTRGTATPAPLENASGTFTSHFGDSTRYGSPNPSLKPIGFNQNGEDWRQRRMKQIAENDPFGLSLNDDARRPGSGRG
ncbi:hypothetical protein GX50_04669 [[Emmonsia] crescens]|uniref:C3H1-type domain-containing protein n=1 Tax=[Emmonsia] crescens TaxID=73230 RepID=A0A2B7Z829_9EURO|nr:hypothetical protein GX50_04669 [Emmonsia crescens]